MEQKTPQRQQADPFSDHLRDALEHYDDPMWLGERSPFAAPYVLDAQLIGRHEAEIAIERGNALRRVLLEVAVSLAKQRDEDRHKAERLYEKLCTTKQYRELYAAQYHNHLCEQLLSGNEAQRILYWRYFYSSEDSYFPKLNTEEIIKKLALVPKTKHAPPTPPSRPAFFRQLKKAIEQLSYSLLVRLTPAVKLEAPPVPQLIVGRTSVLDECLANLRQGKTIALTGLGGVGKTTLAAHIAVQLAPQPVFWFTIRLGLNDRLESILFALSRFLHPISDGGAWRQLIADQGRVRIDLILNHLRNDLKSLTTRLGMLCFDEIDLLRPSDIEAHAQILTFLESLRAEAPLLYIGQRLPIEVSLHGDENCYKDLDGLNIDNCQLMLSQVNIQLSHVQMTQLHDFTKGNPRLLRVFIVLVKKPKRGTNPANISVDMQLSDALQLMAQAPSLQSLINRLWERLSADDIEIIMPLCVYRSYAPRDLWRQNQQTLEALAQLRLVQFDNQSGVAIIPAFRELLYELLSAEEREVFHRKAANARQERGEYTATVYHFIHSNQFGEAVRLWDRHRQREINQGQGDVALALFSTISISQVEGQDRERLALLRSELQKRAGDYSGSLQTLQLAVWQTPLLKIRARTIKGDIYDLQDALPQARKEYHDALDTTHTVLVPSEQERWVGEPEPGLLHAAPFNTFPYRLETSYLYKRLARLSMRELSLDQAWSEVLRARYEAEDMQGQIQEMYEEFEQSVQYYQSALGLAESCDYIQGQAKSHNNLLRVSSLIGRFDEAFRHGEDAYRLFGVLGDRANQASVLVNQSLAHNLAGQPEAALIKANDAYARFSQYGEPWGKAVAAQNMAEAYLALGDLSQAKESVDLVLHEEVPGTSTDALRTLGDIDLQNGDLVSAEAKILESHKLTIELGYRFLQAYSWRSLAAVYQAQGNHQKAKDACQCAITLFQELKLDHEVQKTRRACADLLSYQSDLM